MTESKSFAPIEAIFLAATDDHFSFLSGNFTVVFEQARANSTVLVKVFTIANLTMEFATRSF
jgi:hypothetical protein